MKQLKIADRVFKSRLLLGTGKFSSYESMKRAIVSSESEMVTVALKRVDVKDANDTLLKHIPKNVHLLPNTSGVRTAEEAVIVGELAREALQTSWLKLEIHPDPKYLMPDAYATLKATELLAKKGFIIMPYIHADPVLCKQLYDAGASCVMPLGSAIGSNQGLKTKEFLEIIIEQSKIPVIVDAGIGVPSHAAEAMEMGADAVLVNTAIAVANAPEQMATAFNLGVKSGRLAFESQKGNISKSAQASSPLTSFLE